MSWRSAQYTIGAQKIFYLSSERIGHLQSDLMGGDYDYPHVTDRNTGAEKQPGVLTKGTQEGQSWDSDPGMFH